jgi:hypothetical protein
LSNEEALKIESSSTEPLEDIPVLRIISAKDFRPDIDCQKIRCESSVTNSVKKNENIKLILSKINLRLVFHKTVTD